MVGVANRFNTTDDKAMECSDAIEGLRAKQAELAKTSLEHIEKQYDGITARAEHMIDVIGQLQDITESEGYVASTLYNKTMKSYEQSNLKQLQQEQAKLETALNSALSSKYIEYGTEAWADMQSEIESVESEIYKAKKAIADYDKEIQQAKWDMFDFQQDTVADIQQESSFLTDLLEVEEKLVEDDTGKFTNAGLATLGLHGVSYNADIAQLKDYKDAIAELDTELAKDPYNKTLIDRRQELVKQSREMVKAAEDEKSAIKSLYKDAYDELLSGLQKLIDKRKNLLSDQSDLRDYESTVSEQTTNISGIQKQMMALGGDDSEETQAKLQTLETDLKSAQKELADTEYNRWKSDQQAMLDQIYDEYEQLINERLDNIDALVSEAIDTINANSQTISQTLSSATTEAGIGLTDAMRAIWDGSGNNKVIGDLTQTVSMFTGNFQQMHNQTFAEIQNIKGFVQKMAQYVDKKAAEQVAAAQAKAAQQQAAQRAAAQRQATPAPQPAPQPAQNRGSFFVHKKDYYPKNKLNINTSIVD